MSFFTQKIQLKVNNNKKIKSKKNVKLEYKRTYIITSLYSLHKE